MNADKGFEEALQHHQAGRLPEAEKLYRQILAGNPNHADALHMLGVLAHQSGQNDLALDLIARSITLQPSGAEAYGNLGRVLQARGQLDAAIKCYEQSLALGPRQADVYNNLGTARKAEGKLQEAAEAFRAALRLNPRHVAAHNNLGNLYRSQNRLDDAIASYQRALALRPTHVEALHNLANCFRESGALDQAIASYRRAHAAAPNHPEVLTHLAGALDERAEFGDAIICYQKAVALKPDDAELLIHLGNALMKAGQVAEAIPVYDRAVALQPASAVAQFDLGCALKDAAHPDQAIACFEKALALEPRFAGAANNLGSALKDVARLDEAVASYQRALAIQPDFREAADNLVYAMLFHPDRGPQEIFGALKCWNEQYAQPLAAEIRPHDNDRSPRRPLRIGYVSPDLRDHVVGRNVLPVLMRHDRDRFEIFCYSNVARPDDLTLKFQAHCDGWRDISRSSDAEAVKLIRRDRIDILVDLSLHMAHNRLLIFARKPAPIQATWAGYPGSTGLDTIDYRLSDLQLDPPAESDAFHSEKSIRLPDTFWCYDPLGTDLSVNDLPARSMGKITFGCLNNFAKVNEKTLRLWAAVLREVNSSRLVLLAPQGSARQWVLGVLESQQITPQRIEFRTPRPRIEYLRLYHEIDIALDTFPYNGHTTSLDAMWMGVPVVTIRGNSPVARAGFSQLTNLGLTELAATTPQELIPLAGSLAADLPRLASLRQILRAKMEHSPLMDSKRFTQGLENAYRQMWSKRKPE